MTEKTTRQYKKPIASASDFAKHINGFINRMEAEGTAPTDHRLYQYLGVKPSEYDNLCKGLRPDGTAWHHGDGLSEDERKVWGERDRVEADDAIKKLVAYREDRLVQELEKSRTTSSNVIFQLKQPKNGGYQDIQATDNTAQVTVKVEGIGGLEAFR